MNGVVLDPPAGEGESAAAVDEEPSSQPPGENGDSSEPTNDNTNGEATVNDI